MCYYMFLSINLITFLISVIKIFRELSNNADKQKLYANNNMFMTVMKNVHLL